MYPSSDEFFQKILTVTKKNPHNQPWLKQWLLKKIYHVAFRVESVRLLVAEYLRLFVSMSVKYHGCDKKILLELFYTGS